MERTRDGGKLHTEEHTLPMPNSAAYRLGEGKNRKLGQDELPAQPPRLGDQPEQPFESEALRPPRCAAYKTGVVVERSPNPDRDSDASLLQRSAVPFNPLRLCRRAVCDCDR